MAIDKTCELFDCGHRACGGCGAALAGRLLLKAAGTETGQQDTPPSERAAKTAPKKGAAADKG